MLFTNVAGVTLQGFVHGDRKGRYDEKYEEKNSHLWRSGISGDRDDCLVCLAVHVNACPGCESRRGALRQCLAKSHS
jgi:hypothetical protein